MNTVKFLINHINPFEVMKNDFSNAKSSRGLFKIRQLHFSPMSVEYICSEQTFERCNLISGRRRTGLFP